MAQDRPFGWIKTLEAAWVGLQVRRGRVSGNHQSRGTCVNQADGDSDMVAAWVCELGGGGTNKGTVASASTPVWDKAAPPALALKPDNSVPPHIFLDGSSQAAASAPELRASDPTISGKSAPAP